MRLVKKLLCAAALAMPLAAAHATDGYPAKPIKLVVPFGAGSASDTVARVIAEEVRADLGIVIVDNKAGANGIIGAASVAKAAPDGYTLVLTSSATHSGIAALYKQPGYDPIQDFVHVSRIATIPMVLVARPDAPFQTAQDLAAHARKSRLRYAYGSGSAQIAGATFSTVADAPSDAIPYKSQPPAVTDLLGGQVDYVLADASVVTSFLQVGKLRGLAITGSQRAPICPMYRRWRRPVTRVSTSWSGSAWPRPVARRRPSWRAGTRRCRPHSHARPCSPSWPAWAWWPAPTRRPNKRLSRGRSARSGWPVP